MTNTNLLNNSESNAMARLVNSMVTRPEQPLTALKAVVTNTEIEGFPETLHAIQNMTGTLCLHILLPHLPGSRGRSLTVRAGTQLNLVLTALGQAVEGTVAEKKRRLKITVGIVV